MTDRWVGIIASGDKVTMVDAEVPSTGPLIVMMDQTLKLQAGDRSAAYNTLYQQLGQYFRDNAIFRVIGKASAVSRSSVTLSHLHSAEVRGVVLAAAAAVCETRCLTKSNISRHFGKRTVDEYVADPKFWSDNITGSVLRIGSREAAMLLIAAQGS